MIIFIILIFNIVLNSICVTRIPLTYAFANNQSIKYPIKLSFSQSKTYTPDNIQKLSLYNIDLFLPTSLTPNNKKQVIIGLKYPSQFLQSIAQAFKIQKQYIEFQKDDYMEVVLKDISFVQSTDVFINNGFYSMKIVYNYGESQIIKGEVCQLIDQQTTYFNELFIRQVLNGMAIRNKISYVFDEDEKVIHLKGNLDNFPKISLMREGYLFKLNIANKKIHYIPNSNNPQSPNKISLNSLTQFSKFQINKNQIIFKRTSILYLLYLFLGYFFFFTIGMIIYCKNNAFKSMQFVRNIANWVIFHDNNSRINVLRTQLQ